MFRNILFYVLVILIMGVPLLVGLGNDMVAKDDFHFKNWSYVFMKEFEVGNFDKLYVSAQPGVLTIYSNIIGFKGLYFAKDKLNIVKVEGKSFEILLHFANKLPKVLLIILVGLAISYMLKKLTNTTFSFLFITLMALEPFIIGQVRVIQTDALPMYLGFLALLLFYYYRNYQSRRKLFIVLIGLLVGLCVIEKSLYFLLAFMIVLEMLYMAITTRNWKHYITELLLFSVSLLTTMVVLFPAFWGDFLFTLYRITIGSFIFGIQGYDTESFTYAKTHHIKPYIFYFRFLLNKVSEIVWLGIIFSIVTFKINKIRSIFLTYKLLPLFPIVLFLLLMIAEKKVGRYLVALYPYIVLYATIGYYKVLKTHKKICLFFIGGLILVRLLQFTVYYPDFLMYQNPLTPDRSFNNAEGSWGSGRKKLATYITNTYGRNKIIYAGDPTTLDIFYSGTVKNKGDYKCGSKVDFFITTNPIETICNKKVILSDSYEPYEKLVFYIYKFSDKYNY